MPYVISLLIVAAAIVVLLVLLVRLGGPARRLAWTARLHRAHLADRCGLLSAQVAELRVQLDRRRRPHQVGSPGEPSTA